MLDRTDDSSVAADNWLAQFEEALAKPDDTLLHQLFHPDSYWRDVLALSWNIQTLNGADAILRELAPLARSLAPSGFAPNLDRWMKVIEHRGPAAVQRAYLDTLNGRVPPDQGLILSL